MTEYLTAAALAARLGVQREAVRKAVRAGRLDRSRHGTRFDFTLAVQEWNANRGAAANQADSNGTIAEERRRWIKAKADEAVLRVARQKGEYVRATEVEATWTGYIKRAKTQLEALPSRAKQRDPSLTTAQLVGLQALVQDALIELAGGREEGAA